MNIDESKVKYLYIRDKNRFPVGCIAYIIHRGIINYGLSTYNPRDKFNKQWARDIACARLTTKPKGFAVSTDEHPNDVLADLLTLLHKNKETPTRMHKRLRQTAQQLTDAKRGIIFPEDKPVFPYLPRAEAQ